ncbi:MAG: response regulator [Verrucomicrobiota bacterium]|nr:response regulator [Verrucomicrobiota bacterium]
MIARILAVDDEQAITQMLFFVLSVLGCTFVAVSSVKEALCKVAAQNFDVVITDNNMPELDGLQLVRSLRERNFPGKIVVLSGYLNEKNRAAYDALAVDKMIPKPFDVEQLRREIASLAA